LDRLYISYKHSIITDYTFIDVAYHCAFCVPGMSDILHFIAVQERCTSEEGVSCYEKNQQKG